MTDLERMKDFFLQHRERLVSYNVIDSSTQKQKTHLSEYVIDHIIKDTCVNDFFVLEFPFDLDSELVCVDSHDSFVFEFYFVDRGGKIFLDDAGRTFDCGVEAYEGNGVIWAKKEVTERYLSKNGIQFHEYAIKKQTDIESFVGDTVTFVKALQTLNGARPYPPYLLELDDAREVEDALTRCWICGEKSERCENARTLSLFDKQKVKEEHATCEEGVYPKLSNKLAFIGVFFDSDGRVLLRKQRTQTGILYDFAIRDYVLKDEYDSLMGLQRAVRQCFGFDFYFGDFAPAVTLTQKRLILDFYVIPRYDVSEKELCGDGEADLEWFTREAFFDLIAANRFESYPQGLPTLLYGL